MYQKARRNPPEMCQKTSPPPGGGGLDTFRDVVLYLFFYAGCVHMFKWQWPHSNVSHCTWLTATTIIVSFWLVENPSDAHME